ncbi:MAG: outer membrane beta-barrel protein [Myxococcales bacterium]|nr:porin [Deltaproteobacteria bacterium]NNL24514.1 outer membrane beta-barrel protein [Myxococcales bacterium]
MRKFLSLAVMCSLAFPAMALAQPEAPKEAADDMAMEAEGIPETGTSAEFEMPESPKTAADDMAMEGDEAASWKDGISWMVMGSAFYRLGGYIGDGVLAGTYNSIGYPYTQYNGFGLNFVGGDFQYTGEKFALRIDLRFGEGAALLTPISASGFGGLKQGYVSWLPSDKVAIDFGFFDTIFGGEVVDEWNNANYTRGALYFNRQPFNHMGIRSAFSLTDTVGMTLMVTNGGVLGGTPIDGNETPTLGWQFAFSDAEENFGFFFGGQHGASNPNDNKNWEQFFDWVLTANAGIFSLIANGDYQLTPTAVSGGTSSAFAYGHSIQLIFDASDKVSIGLRGEHLSGNEQHRLTTGQPFLATGTATLRYKPVQYLVLSLEYRGEWTSAADRVYYSRAALDPTTGELGAPDKRANHALILGFTAYIAN